jgi:hypothetical protein
MIPNMMIMDTPLPIPLSVIRSPSQRMNMLPAARMTVEAIMNDVQPMEGFSAPPDMCFRFTR